VFQESKNGTGQDALMSRAKKAKYKEMYDKVIERLKGLKK